MKPLSHRFSGNPTKLHGLAIKLCLVAGLFYTSVFASPYYSDKAQFTSGKQSPVQVQVQQSARDLQLKVEVAGLASSTQGEGTIWRIDGEGIAVW
jgi:hypothetical protein